MLRGMSIFIFNLNFSRIQNQRVPLIFVLGIKYCMWIGKVSQSMTPECFQNSKLNCPLNFGFGHRILYVDRQSMIPESFPQSHPILMDILIN